MRWSGDREGRALRRIVALLLALAQLAERAGCMALPVRVIVLAVLRHAETVAFAFVDARCRAVLPFEGRAIEYGASGAPSTMLRMVPLPRFAGEDMGLRPASTSILPRSRGRGTAEGGGGGAPICDCPPGASSESHHGPAEAARLAFSLRVLALILAHWATETLMPPPVPLFMSRAVASSLGRPGANWRGPAALPAPDTS
jgi:hypothetical protein